MSEPVIECIGEIVEASTARLVAQCPPHRLHAPPLFGAFVRVGSQRVEAELEASVSVEVDPFADPLPRPSASLPPTTPEGSLYAVVTEAMTGSTEPWRRPAAYGLTEEELRAQQPQIFDLISTQFVALPIGYAEGERFRALLPPRPPRLHAFVWDCTATEVIAITDNLEFLRRLLPLSGAISGDELVVACLLHAYAQRQGEFAFLVEAGKYLAVLLRSDPERLNALLKRLEP